LAVEAVRHELVSKGTPHSVMPTLLRLLPPVLVFAVLAMLLKLLFF
jgi:hypothetical protein